MRIITNSTEETENAGAALAKLLKAGDVVAMHGELGAGKTAFVRGIARGLGIDTRVTSPTFTIVNEYPGKIPLFHFDMYRLAGAEELYDIGWEDYLERGGICVCEWSEVSPEAFPDDSIKLYINKTGDDSREIMIDLGDRENENTCH